MTATMKAAVIRAWGGPEVLEYITVDVPPLGEGDLLVQVEACALNLLDVLVRRGIPRESIALPHVGGADIVGRVVAGRGGAAGGLVDRHVLLDPMIGVRMLGQHRWGGLAEFVVAPAGNAIPLRRTTRSDLHRYAALPVAYGTAHRMLFSRARLSAGETVLVLGAAGGVGVACVQLGHRVGARVIASSTSDEKLRRLREIGADATINLETEDLRRALHDLAPSGVDVVVDFLGESTWPLSLRCVRSGGRLVTCGNTTGHLAQTDLRHVWVRELNILGSNGWTADDLRALAAMVDAGELSPVIHRAMCLSRVHGAFEEVEQRRAIGKVIVVPDAVAEGALEDGRALMQSPPAQVSGREQ